MAGKQRARSEDFKTVECRLSYARDLFVPRAQDKDKTPKYGATLIFPKSYKAELEKIIAKVITDEWGPAGIERAKKGLIKSPILAGDGKQAHTQSGELRAGMGPDVIFLRPTANGDRPPQVRWKDPNLQETETNVYSGCYGKAVIHFYAWNHPQSGDMISAGISMFQKLREGERLGGGGPIDTDKYYETIADEGGAPESTADGTGAGGLFGA